jgi:hypothetical protein
VKCSLCLDHIEKGVAAMRQFLNIMRSRAALILGGAVAATLVLPVTAFAGGLAAPNAVHHRAISGAGGSSGLAIFLGVVAVAVLSVLILALVGAEREGDQRVAKPVRRKPASIAS